MVVHACCKNCLRCVWEWFGNTSNTRVSFHLLLLHLHRYKSLPNTGTTATVEDDYTRTTGRLFFPRFVSSIVFQVPIIQDAILEDPDEHVEIVLFDTRYEDTAFVAPVITCRCLVNYNAPAGDTVLNSIAWWTICAAEQQVGVGVDVIAGARE